MLNFPSTPTIGDKYPQPPLAGVPVYMWDGEKWTTSVPQDVPSFVRKSGDTMTGDLTLLGNPTNVLHAAPKQYVDAGVGTKLNIAGGQTTTGGFKVTPPNLGNISGACTPNLFLGNYQIMNNAGAITMNIPNGEGGIDLLVWNTATAGAITFSGYSVGAGKTGDALTTTAGHMFVISLRRFSAGVSTYVIKALQ